VQKDSQNKLQEELHQLEKDLKLHWEQAVQEKLDNDLITLQKALDTNLEQVKKDLQKDIKEAKAVASEAKGSLIKMMNNDRHQQQEEDIKALKDELLELGQALKKEQTSLKATLENDLSERLKRFEETSRKEHGDMKKSLEEKYRILKETVDEASEEQFQGLEEAKEELGRLRELDSKVQSMQQAMQAQVRDVEISLGEELRRHQEEMGIFHGQLEELTTDLEGTTRSKHLHQ